MAIPLPPRGGQALPPAKAPGPAKLKPGAPGTPGWKTFTAARWASNHQPQIETAQANTSALNAFHTALQQLRAATPAVNTAPILAPYQSAETAASQLGTGLQQAEANAGTTAQNQYASGLNQAQQAATSFGISAGAGANPTALSNNGTAPIAAVSQAQQAAAPQAAAAWQALLERTGANAVSNAQVARENSLTAGGQSLAASLPSLINTAKTQAFQRATQAQNMELAESQLTEKEKEALNSDVIKQQGITASNQRTAATIQGANSRSAASIAAADQRAANALTAKQKSATVSGIKGISQVNSLLKTASSGTTKAAKGWDVTLETLDPNTGLPTGVTTTKHLPSKTAPPGFKVVAATTHYETVPKSGGKLSFATWSTALRQLQAQNPGTSPSLLIPLLPPRPKK